ncbi:MAG: SDR family oxidoreductase [Candidatus Neomarinimicrobiota bacterium]
MKLEQMICVVTGASGGTGPAVVNELDKRCKTVVGVVRGIEVEWKETPNASSRKENPVGPGHFEVSADILSQTSVAFLVSEILRNLDAFHVWINLVGGFLMGNLVEETDSDHWPKMFDLNFISTLNCCKKILPIFKSQGFGRIINFGSTSGVEGMARAAPYAVSKAAVINLTKTLAQEGKEYSVTANVIVPTTIDTPGNRKAMPEADFSKWTRPEQIALEIVSLIESDRSGEVVYV